MPFFAEHFFWLSALLSGLPPSSQWLAAGLAFLAASAASPERGATLPGLDEAGGAAIAGAALKMDSPIASVRTERTDEHLMTFPLMIATFGGRGPERRFG